MMPDGGFEFGKRRKPGPGGFLIAGLVIPASFDLPRYGPDGE